MTNQIPVLEKHAVPSRLIRIARKSAFSRNIEARL
jgi:hypothetical protein